ncbi:MAG: hypothetical protein D6691_04215 [Candidatus Hydrogenedentota bacterium]|uniref:Lipoprotein n=1 Tax=Sumerlaea chitinivorans TaxID=2250252 RepID=A0A2Z4Y3G1_SUMC1|nr:hypothetical protein BRCON_0641 [Candidatus Sumerlaea chitinivorans]RMH28779.1 MAG: hypothetical protein D6691_04215 [Candidatus Hydrogenedentota bacterium]
MNVTQGDERKMKARQAVWLGMIVATSFLAGCSLAPNWKHPVDVPMTYEGREQICLYNLERLQDAKQEWARDTHARPGAFAPDAKVLASRYLRQYEYGRRYPWDDDTQRSPLYTPKCPSGGEYVIGRVGERPICTAHGDLLRAYDTHIRVPQTH